MNSWTWGTALTYATRNMPDGFPAIAPRRFAEWSQNDTNWLPTEHVDTAFERWLDEYRTASCMYAY